NGKHARFAKLVSGPVFGELVADTDWVAPDGRLVCSDRRTLRAWGTEGVRLLDFEIAIASATSDLTFGDDKEGTFGLRVPPWLQADQKKGSPYKGGKLINAEGKENAAVWGKPSPWCDYSGEHEGKTVGVAIFDSPTNFRHPTTWHARTYGLFAVNPFGLSYFSGIKDKAKQPNGSHVTPRGKPLVLRYRVYLHDGDAQAAKVAEHFTAFASPARAEAKR
ncbi:MAG TPA: PmoA family protein, partial [Planctomycetia bacterium]|nr:PmoA family protein [Planctomycetia bacterium]